MNQPRMWWSGDLQMWIIDVDQPLTLSEQQRCIDFTAKVQAERYLGLHLGDKKDECLKTIQALKAGKVQQNIIGKGEKVLYDAYKSDKKFFDFSDK